MHLSRILFFYFDAILKTYFCKRNITLKHTMINIVKTGKVSRNAKIKTLSCKEWVQ